MLLTMQQIDDRNLSKRSTHLGRSTISITSDVLGFLGYEGPLRSKTGRGEKAIKRSKALIKKKKDYRSIIDITFISDVVSRMVAISTSNKNNG